MPLTRASKIFFSGFFGALIFGALFGFLGLMFADHLGFPLAYGTEEISMGASMIFYGKIGLMAGALAGALIASKAGKRV